MFNHVSPSETFKIFFLTVGCDQKRSFLIIGVGDIALSIVRGKMGITILFFFRVLVYTNTHMNHIIWNINEDKIVLPTCMTYYPLILIRCEALQRGSFLLRARIKALRVLQVEVNIQSMGVWYRYQRIDASLWRKLWTCTHC